jgi:hypothetical protein
MKKTPVPSDPATYVASLSGWHLRCVEALRSAVLDAAEFEEVIKWGHLVYLSNGPALLIRAEEARVLFGFWRGKRLTGIEPELRPGGKFEMATLTLNEDSVVDGAKASALAAEAARLNAQLGDPTKAARGG